MHSLSHCLPPSMYCIPSLTPQFPVLNAGTLCIIINALHSLSQCSTPSLLNAGTLSIINIPSSFTASLSLSL